MVDGRRAAEARKRRAAGPAGPCIKSLASGPVNRSNSASAPGQEIREVRNIVQARLSPTEVSREVAAYQRMSVNDLEVLSARNGCRDVEEQSAWVGGNGLV